MCFGNAFGVTFLIPIRPLGVGSLGLICPPLGRRIGVVNSERGIAADVLIQMTPNQKAKHQYKKQRKAKKPVCVQSAIWHFERPADLAVQSAKWHFERPNLVVVQSAEWHFEGPNLLVVQSAKWHFEHTSLFL